MTQIIDNHINVVKKFTLLWKSICSIFDTFNSSILNHRHIIYKHSGTSNYFPIKSKFFNFGIIKHK